MQQEKPELLAPQVSSWPQPQWPQLWRSGHAPGVKYTTNTTNQDCMVITSYITNWLV